MKVHLGFIAICLISGSLARKFPESFKFGTATASYQIEGGWNEDGKGLNMWDVWSHVPGHIANNDTGDVACDSYHKYKEDVQIMKELGVKIYRFSISWARVLPDGTPNKINQAGLQYYIDLVNELEANGIEPMVTLYHWDLPEHLHRLGGWLNPEIANYFGDYSRIMYENLGSHVKYWITINEPLSTCVYAYGMDRLAPALNLSDAGVYQCAYTHIKAHARAYHIYDQEFRKKQQGKVTINIPIQAWYPKSDTPEDIEATERMFEFAVGLYANPIYNGNWPQVVIDRVAYRSKLEGYSFSRLPELTPEEINYINGTFDYFSVNIYTSFLCENSQEAPSSESSYDSDSKAILSKDPSWPQSTSDWLTSYPKGLRLVLNQVQKKYNPSEIIITENGWSDDGQLQDNGRIDYLKGYLNNLLDAIYEDGINVVGYTVWSLMDNFEWASGYTKKFGIVQVDFNSPNRTRTWKDSARWYQKLVASREIDD